MLYDRARAVWAFIVSDHSWRLTYPAKPSYSHCVKLGRSDCHFSTAARVKKTVTPPTDKTVTVLALVS